MKKVQKMYKDIPLFAMGIGNSATNLLHIILYHFDQIAMWNKDQQSWVGEELGFPGRPERESWVSKAKSIASGGSAKPAKKKAKRGEIVVKRKSRK